MKYNVCIHCKIPDKPGYGDPEAENDFTCTDCACYGCNHRENCHAQCGMTDEQFEEWLIVDERRKKAMQFVLINTAEKKFLEKFALKMIKGSIVYDEKHTEKKSRACLFIDAESAVFMAGFLNWLKSAQVFFAIPYDDDNAIAVLMR